MRLLKLSPSTVVFFSLALFLPTPFSFACDNGIWGPGQRIALYQEDLGIEPVLDKFIYGFWDSDYYPSEPQNLEAREEKMNLAEWRQALGGQFSDEEILRVLYAEDEEKIMAAVRQNKLKTVFPNNAFVKALSHKKNKAFAAYFALAKEMEYFFLSDEDPWEVMPKAKNATGPYSLDILLARALKGLESAREPFLKRRFAFQTLRIYFFMDKNAECIETFRKHFLPGGYNHFVGIWAAQLASGAAFRSNQEALGNYYAALTFDAGYNRKFGALRQFNNEEDLLEPTLNLASTDRERAAVHALFAVRNPWKSAKHIEAIIGLDPSSPYLPLVLNREVNKIEHWLLTPMVRRITPTLYEAEYIPDGFPDNVPDTYTNQYYSLARFRDDQRYLAELREMLAKNYVRAKNGPSAGAVSLAIAHLFLLDKNAAEARTWLDKTPENGDPKQRAQLLIEQILCEASDNLDDPKVRDNLALSLQKLEALWEGQKSAKGKLTDLYDYFSDRYKRIGNLAIAHLFHQKNLLLEDWYRKHGLGYLEIEFLNRHASPDDVRQVLLYLEKKAARPNLLVDFLMPSKPDIAKYQELLGTLYFRQGQYEEAIKAWKPLPDTYWQTANNGAFNSYLTKSPFAIYLGAEIVPFPENGKKGVAVRMAQLENSLEFSMGDPKQTWLELGHAYFNISYYGNSWMMVAYGKSENERCGENNWFSYGDFYPNCQAVSKNYYKLDRARQAYQVAFDLSVKTDREVAAEAAFMLHYLAYLESDYSKIVWWAVGVEQPTLQKFESKWWNIFQDLGKNTVYAEAVSNCLN